MTVKNFVFQLDVKDGWPPVGSESLPFQIVASGYELLVPPLFVRNLSVGDELVFTWRDDGVIDSWLHVAKSGRSVVWLLRTGPNDQISIVLDKLRAVGCNTSGSEQIGCFAADIPENLDFDEVDAILASLNPEAAAVAFPSMRHAEA